MESVLVQVPDGVVEGQEELVRGKVEVRMRMKVQEETAKYTRRHVLHIPGKRRAFGHTGHGCLRS